MRDRNHSPNSFGAPHHRIPTMKVKHSSTDHPNCSHIDNLFQSFFSAMVEYDALLVRGNYPQQHMNNQVGQSLCLFNRQTRQAYVSEMN